jgi:hypothetical protein
MRRASVTLLTAALILALSSVTAFGHDGGEGTWGETNDRVVTNAGFILIAFFPAFVFVVSLIQWQLEKRKEAKKAAAQARAGSDVWRGGW